jgi:LPXTG-motif cell wall-anchored protein
VPSGGSCTVTAQCETGLTCVDDICTKVSAPAPATSSAGLLVGLGLLTAVGVFAIFRRRDNANRA